MSEEEPILDTGARYCPTEPSAMEIEDHRSSRSLFVGVHLPASSGRRRRHGHHSRPSNAADRHASDSNSKPVDPSHHVMFLLDDSHEAEPFPALFCEMDELFANDNDTSHSPTWKEAARWIKFEEAVEKGGERWSKPHVATLPLYSLFELRKCLTNAVIILNMEATTIEQVTDLMLNELIAKGQLNYILRDKVKDIMLRKHSHLYARQNKSTKSQLPIIRSLADIGRKYSSKDIDKRNSTSEGKKSSKKKKKANKELWYGADNVDSTEYHTSNNDNEYPTSERRFTTSSTNDIKDDIEPDEISEEKRLAAQQRSRKLTSSVPYLDHEHLLKLQQGVDSHSNMRQSASVANMEDADNNTVTTDENQDEGRPPQKFDANFMKKIPAGSETSNILVGETDFITTTLVCLIRLKEASLLGEITEVPLPTRFIFLLLGPNGNADKFHQIGRSMATLMSDEIFRDVAYKARDGDDFLAAIDEFLSSCTVLPPGEWDPSIRIEPPKSVPSQEPRKTTASHSAGIPPPQKGLQSNNNSSAGLQTSATMNGEKRSTADPPPPPRPAIVAMKGIQPDESENHGEDPTLMRTGRIFGGLMADVKRRWPHYLSDFKEGIHVQCFASFFFLYFACLTPIITFGGLLEKATGGYLGTMESILAGALVGVVYALFSGQPLTIMGSTGPVLVFEKIIYTSCKSLQWEYLSFRMCVGLWVALILLIFVMYDLSYLVKFITRFTEESFAFLIALIFIIQAFSKLLHILDDYPVNRNWTPSFVLDRNCTCLAPSNNTFDFHDPDFQAINKLRKPPLIYNITNTTTNATDIMGVDWDKISSDFFSWDWSSMYKMCKELGGGWEGSGCGVIHVPDVFFFSCLLFVFTFILSYGLKIMRDSRFFPTMVRQLISDFAVMIAISSMTVIDLLFDLHTPKLNVPERFEPTLGYEVRGWIINPIGRNPVWTVFAALGPALLAVILIFMDQQITAVIVNRKENKLKKGAGYHLDLLLVAILIAVNSTLGIPWFVAATVLSINHVMSLKKTSGNAAPGESAVFLGCREQRVTGVIIFLTIGLSVFLTPILTHIPMAVLYGVFLFMGVSSLRGVQLMQRIFLLAMPQKYQPDYIYLRYVPIKRVHLFTLIQVICLALLFAIKSYDKISIAFPLMVLLLCFIRKALEFIFKPHELKWLDDLMPEWKKREEDDADLAEDEQVVEVPLEDGQVVSIGMNQLAFKGESMNMTEEMVKSALWKQLNASEPRRRKHSTGNQRRRRASVATGMPQNQSSGLTGESRDEEPLLSKKGGPDIVVSSP